MEGETWRKKRGRGEGMIGKEEMEREEGEREGTKGRRDGKIH